MAQIFFSSAFKNKIIFNFVKIVATLKGMKTNFFHPSLLLLFSDPGYGIRDPGWEKNRIRYPGSGVDIPDPLVTVMNIEFYRLACRGGGGGRTCMPCCLVCCRAGLPYKAVSARWRPLSRKLKSRYGARNRFQEPSLELSS
jgi:hypothetical protein